MKNKIYKHRIDVSHYGNSYERTTGTIDWCYATFGDPDKGKPTWDVIGPGIYGFVNETDATMFKLKWS